MLPAVDYIPCTLEHLCWSESSSLLPFCFGRMVCVCVCLCLCLSSRRWSHAHGSGSDCLVGLTRVLIRPALIGLGTGSGRFASIVCGARVRLLRPPSFVVYIVCVCVCVRARLLPWVAMHVFVCVCSLCRSICGCLGVWLCVWLCVCVCQWQCHPKAWAGMPYPMGKKMGLGPYT